MIRPHHPAPRRLRRHEHRKACRLECRRGENGDGLLIRPDLVREACTHWAVENNPYQLWHRGYSAVSGGAQDCAYTFMQDMVAGTYRLPWHDDVVHTDGTSCGFERPMRRHDPHNMRDAPASKSLPSVPSVREVA